MVISFQEMQILGGNMTFEGKSCYSVSNTIVFCSPYGDIESIDPVRSISHHETLILLCLSGQSQPLLWP